MIASPMARKNHNASLLTTPDGMPMVWMGRLAGHKTMGRVYGPDLMEAVFAWTQRSGHTHFFYGGNTGVAEELKAKLEQRFPGIRVVGTYTPPFRPLDETELADLAAQVRAAQPDFFWVGQHKQICRIQPRRVAEVRHVEQINYLVYVCSQPRGALGQVALFKTGVSAEPQIALGATTKQDHRVAIVAARHELRAPREDG